MRYLTAGESHGPELTAIIEGFPAGLEISEAELNTELARRQKGYGRGGRMKIEQDTVKITAGVRHGKTLGSPITLSISNRDWKNWQTVMAPQPVEKKAEDLRRVVRPRPGHADLVGGMKYRHRDLRNVLERSSARETALRVAIGGLAKQLLTALDIEVASHVVELGGITTTPAELTLKEIQQRSEASAVRVVDPTVEAAMIEKINATKKNGDTLGGVVEVRVANVPAGLGSYVQWDRKLDGKLAQAILSINAFKGVEFGVGFTAAKHPGSEVMDEITWDETTGFKRATDHLGGFEGGMTNGEQIIVRGVMKPIPTLYRPLNSVDIETKAVYKASVERSDTTAVPAAAVVAENVVATIIANEITETFHSDSLTELQHEFQTYKERLKNF